jgi:hypothetical protein
MAALTINGFSVLDALIVLPSFGAWHADISADVDEAQLADVPLTITDGAASFAAVVDRGGDFRGRGSMRVIGGKGKLATEIGPKAYRAVPLRTVLVDILDAAGETLSPDVDDPALANFVPHWQRVRGSAGTALSELTDSIGRVWRVQNDGTIFVGVDDYPAQEVDHEITSEDPRLGVTVIAPESFDLRPAVTFLGRQVSRVHHILEPGTRRSEVWFND